MIRNAEYIAYEKKSPGTARSILKGLRKEIGSLATNPERHMFDEDAKVVYILRVLHMLVDSKALFLRIVKD